MGFEGEKGLKPHTRLPVGRKCSQGFVKGQAWGRRGELPWAQRLQSASQRLERGTELGDLRVRAREWIPSPEGTRRGECVPRGRARHSPQVPHGLA